MLLANQTWPADEVIVVDQTPPELRDEQVREEMRRLPGADNVRWLRMEQPGLTRARNLALRRASGQVLIFLDDDVYLGPGFVEAHLENYLDPAVRCVSGGVRCGTMPLPVPLEGQLDRGPLGYLHSHNGYDARIRHFNRICGGNFSIRSETARAIGGFDENFIGPSHREDVDLYMRLKEHGVEVVFDPRPWIYHIRLESGGGRAPGPSRAGTLAYNASYFALGHLWGRHLAIFLWKKVLRATVLNRATLLRPWTLPVEAFRLVRDFARAARAARSGPRLPGARAAGGATRERAAPTPSRRRT
jgi:GT2 family glycosyltransferase